MIKNHRRVVRMIAFLPLLFIWMFLFQWSCGDGPTKYNVEGQNSPPETNITSKTLSKVDLETDSLGAVLNYGEFSFTIEYSGTDLDGTVDSFMVRIDDGPWPEDWSSKTFYSGTADFASDDDVHQVEVKSKDNEGLEDPTPAVAKLSLAEIKANKLPTTAFVSGPTDGATTGRAAMFEVNGKDEGGKVIRFIYSVDGGDEVSVATVDEGKAIIEFSLTKGNLFSLGNHSISCRSVDNLGGEDPTPSTRSFFVSSGFKPILTQTGGPPPGGGWFTGANIPFDWDATTSYYSGVIDHHEYSVDDPSNFTSISESKIALAPKNAGPHTFRVRAVDTEGNISETLEVQFDVALFAPTEGILFIDNVSFTPGGGPYTSEPEMDQMILAGFFKNFTKVSVWDVDHLSGSKRFPGAINSASLPGPADLARFSSVVVVSDGGYTIDNVSALLAAYFQAGGNLMITGYASKDFGQVLKDVMGTPSIYNGYGTNLQSLEGFQAASGRNSDAYSFISGTDVVPVIPGITNRSWEITTNTSQSKRILFANVFEGGSFGGYRIATEIQGEKGNWGIWIGVSLFYLDQTSSGIVKLGDFILGNRFGEI